MALLATSFGTGQVLWDMLWLFMFIIWFWLLVTVFGDSFRSPDLSGVMKMIWVIFVIILPYLGVFIYLIARRHKMQAHAVAAVQAQDEAARQYIQGVAGGGSAADEIARLADLKDKGHISEAEFQAGKAKVLGT